MFSSRAETRRRNSWMTAQGRQTEQRDVAKGADQLATCENRMTLIRGPGNRKYGKYEKPVVNWIIQTLGMMMCGYISRAEADAETI